MPPTRADSPHSPPRRRADAERSIARILDAAVDALASDPEATAIIEAAEPDREDAAGALRRVVESAWRTLGRYHALVAINARLAPADLRRRHGPALAVLEPLIERGQRDGAFRADVPAAWHLSAILALIHAASGELGAGRLPSEQVESVLVASVLGAVSAVPPR
jgi:hypothetical protein